MINNLTVVVINFQTPDLLKTAVESFRYFYPQEKILIIDNGSKDNSKDAIKLLAELNIKQTKTIFLDKNIYHGPAMDMAIKSVQDEYIFFLDSDTVTHKHGFLESMINLLSIAEKNYGIGWRNIVNKRGFITSKEGVPITRSAYMMLKRNLYFLFPPFIHHGLPVLQNFTEAHSCEYSILQYPIEEYINHIGRGSASRYGYNLGIKGKIDFALNKLGL